MLYNSIFFMRNVSRIEEYIVTNNCRDHLQLFFSADCGPPPQIANGTARTGMSYTVYEHPTTTAYYYCNVGARLVGNRSIDCRDDGTWEDPPMCVPPGEYMK